MIMRTMERRGDIFFDYLLEKYCGNDEEVVKEMHLMYPDLCLHGICGFHFFYRDQSNDLGVILECVKDKVYLKKLAKQCLLGPDRARIWVDLGMHIGAFSSYAVSAGCTVYGFEPEETNYRLALLNVPLNIQFGGSFEGYEKAVVPKAMMNKKKMTKLFYASSRSNRSRHSVLTGYPQRHPRMGVMVETITLEEIFETYPHVEGLKIDIEGAEVPVLQEITWVPHRLRWIVLEYSFDYFRGMTRFSALMHRLRTWFAVDTNVCSQIVESYELYPRYPWSGYIFAKRRPAGEIGWKLWEKQQEMIAKV